MRNTQRFVSIRKYLKVIDYDFRTAKKDCDALGCSNCYFFTNNHCFFSNFSFFNLKDDKDKSIYNKHPFLTEE